MHYKLLGDNIEWGGKEEFGRSLEGWIPFGELLDASPLDIYL